MTVLPYPSPQESAPGVRRGLVTAPCLTRLMARLQPSLPVATSLQAYEPPMPRVGKVAGDQERILRLGPLNHLLPRLHCLGRIHIEGKHPVRLSHLRRIGRDVPNDQGPLAPGDNGQPHGARGMAWCRDRGDLTGQRLFSRQEFKDTQGLQGAESLLPERKWEVPLHRWRLKRLPVGLVCEIARQGKGGLRRAAS